LLAAMGGLPISVLAQTGLTAPGPDRLVLLGTRGGPFVGGMTPSPSSSLLAIAGAYYLVDAGYGATMKLLAAGVSPAALRHIFITHHHSDHNLELGPLLYNGWVAGRRGPVDVHGPPGLSGLIAAYWESMRFDIETRIADEGRADIRQFVNVHEHGEGPIVEDGEVRISALRNLHPPIRDSFALKFEAGARKVVFSGDTAYFPPLAEFALNADYLVHEILYPDALAEMLRSRPNANRLRASILRHHTIPADVGRIAADANVRALVLNHFVPADPGLVTEAMWAQAVRQTFDGRLVIGRDLMELPL
jgi:ribonuclease BN (tRNA processing enzyme)